MRKNVHGAGSYVVPALARLAGGDDRRMCTASCCRCQGGNPVSIGRHPWAPYRQASAWHGDRGAASAAWGSIGEAGYRNGDWRKGIGERGFRKGDAGNRFRVLENKRNGVALRNRTSPPPRHCHCAGHADGHRSRHCSRHLSGWPCHNGTTQQASRWQRQAPHHADECRQGVTAYR